jgi:hypothetical protein
MQDIIETTEHTDPSMTALVSGILNDSQELIKQQIALMKSEIRADLVRARDGATYLAAGVGTLVLGGIVLCFMVVHLLNWALETPTWAGFGMVGGGLVVLGFVFYGLGLAKFSTLNPVPEESVRAVKENVQWLKNQK